jgi:hypothetical protein
MENESGDPCWRLFLAVWTPRRCRVPSPRRVADSEHRPKTTFSSLFFSPSAVSRSDVKRCLLLSRGMGTDWKIIDHERQEMALAGFSETCALRCWKATSANGHRFPRSRQALGCSLGHRIACLFETGVLVQPDPVTYPHRASHGTGVGNAVV